MIKTNLNVVASSYELFKTVLLSAQLPAKLSFNIARVNKAIAAEVELFEEQRIALFKKYGVEEEGSIRILDENVEAFKKEMDELVSQEFILYVNVLNIDDFPDTFVIKPEELMVLSYLFE